MKPIAPAVHGWKLRSVLGLTHGLFRLGLVGTHKQLRRMPLEKRAAIVPAPWMLLPMPAVDIERTTLPGRAGPIPVKRFSPRKPGERTQQVLFIHGGGWVAGGVDALDYLCTHLCDRLGVVVTSVGYRLAPEHPFPAGLEDCEDAFECLAAEGLPIVVAGDSAGGNLAAALCLRKRGRREIRRQVLIYPALDLTLGSPSHEPSRHGYSKREFAIIVELYRGSAAATDPFLSPLHAPDLAGLPPAIVVTADADPLRDDGIRYAERLRAAGVPVRLENYIGMPHAFLSIASLCPAAPACIDMLVDELRA
jgi:acetyl esterase